MAFGAARNKRPEYIEPGDFIFAERLMIAMGVKVVAAVQ